MSAFLAVPYANAATKYWDGAGTWTDANSWSLTSGGPYTQTWASGDDAVFDVVSTITGATTSFKSITANQNVTVTAGGTLGTGGTVATVTVATGKVLNFGTQAISTAAGTGFIKDGLGTWSLAGSAYTGNFTINAGTVAIAGANALGANTAGRTLTINGGTIRSNSTTARDLTGDFSGGIIIGGNFTLGGTAGLVDGALTFTNNMALGAATRQITVDSAVSFGGIISGSSGVGLTKAGVGTLTLSNASNTYTGETVIKTGTLKVNTTTTIGSSNKITVGDTGSSGTVLDATAAGLTVGASQTLAGIGTVDAAGQIVTVNGTLAPGNSPGTLAITASSLDLANATGLAFELNPSNTTVGAAINDLVSLTGNLNLDGLLSVVATSGDFLSVTANTSWRLFNYSGGLTDDTLEFGSMPALGSGLGWSIDTATAGQVNLVVIPEPNAAALLGGLGVLALLRRRR